MTQSRRIPFIPAVMVLLLVSLACGPLSSPGSQPTPTGFGLLPTPPAASGIPAAKKAQLVKATVRLTAYKSLNGAYQPVFYGSGTVLTPEGHILTNAHIAAPAEYGAPEYQYDLLVVEVADKENAPPIPSYLSKVLAVDPALDLAVIKVDKNLNGSPLAPGSVNLTYAGVGNSDTVQLADPLTLLGYAPASGQNIKILTSRVVGFMPQETVGSRAWIATETNFPAEMTGGLAANNVGDLVGIPVRGNGQNVYEKCVPRGDVNGDGKVDEKDCAGGNTFLRPINLALTLIQAARSGLPYTSPYKKMAQVTPSAPTPTLPPLLPTPMLPTPIQPTQPLVPTGVRPPGDPKFTPLAWTTGSDGFGCPLNCGTSFPSGVKKILAIFSYTDIPSGADWSRRWLINGREVALNKEKWTKGSSGDCFALSLTNEPNPLPDGNYTIELFVGTVLAGTMSTTVGGSGPLPGPCPVPTPGPGVSKDGAVEGKVVDANTKQGIADALVYLLKPGVEVAKWQQNPTEAELFATAKTDASGAFKIAPRLTRNVAYGLIISAREYRGYSGYLKLFNYTADPLVLTMEISK
ncbi:MAG TPA: serine protease [Anaerolineaceae bacterium]